MFNGNSCFMKFASKWRFWPRVSGEFLHTRQNKNIGQRKPTCGYEDLLPGVNSYGKYLRIRYEVQDLYVLCAIFLFGFG